MLQNLLHGLTNLGSAQTIAYLVGGSLIGVFLGVIPGLGGAVILSIILAFINHISIDGTVCLFLAVQAGSYFSASVTSILLNTPAHPEAFAVTFDGFPMAQRGEAGRALGISAASTCIGGVIGCVVLVGFIQIMNYLPLAFHPPEYVALIILAMLLVGTLGTDAISKALISAGLGIVVASIGTSAITAIPRYTFNAIALQGGISLVGLVLGLFAIPQMMLVFGTATTIARQDMTGREVEASAPVALGKGFARQLIGGIVETSRHWVALVRAALIGVLTGIVPGIGGFAANFMSYGIAQQSSKKRAQFGTGIPEGIIAPEGSSLAKEAGGLIPLLGLGLPGGVGAALFLAALSIKGIRLGSGFAKAYPSLPYEMAWVIALGGIIGTLAGVLTAPGLARVTRVPGPCLVPFIMSTTVVGVFVSEVAFFAVMEMAVFVIVGFVLRRLRYSVAAFAVGLVLGPTLEQNIYLTHTLFPGFAFLGKRPLADGLFFLALVVLVAKAVQMHRDARLARLSVAAQVPSSSEGSQVLSRSPYPLLNLTVSLSVAIFSVLFVIYGVTRYDFSTEIMPAVAGSIAAAAALWRIPLDAQCYWQYRATKRQSPGINVANPKFEVEQHSVGELLSQTQTSSVAVLAGLMEPLPTELVEPMSTSFAAVSNGGLPQIQEKQWGLHGQYTREVVALLWFSGLIAFCYFLGFVVGVPAFCMAYGLFATRRVFRTATRRIIFAAATSIAMWAVTFAMISALHVSYTPIVNF